MSIITLARPCSFLHPALVRIRTSVQLKLEGIFILTMKTIKKIPTAKTADQIHSFRDFKSSLSLASFSRQMPITAENKKMHPQINHP